MQTKIGQRFLLTFLTISLLPLMAMGWFSISRSEAALREQTSAVLRSASDGAEAQLREFLSKLREQLQKTEQDEGLRDALRNQLAASRYNPASGADSFSEMLALEQNRLADVQEIFVLTTEGRVTGSSTRESVGKDFSSAKYFQQGKQGFFPGNVILDADTGRVTWVMSTPIHDGPSGRLLGILAFRINPETLSDLTSGHRVLAQGADTQSFRIGDAGETYIVNQDRFMITESRYVSNAVLRIRVDTPPVRAGLERGQEITADYTNYQGTEVSGASMVLHDLGWVVVTEIDFRQVFAVINQMRHSVLELAAGLGLLVAFLAWDATRRIIEPIQRLSDSDRALGRGDEAAAIVSEEGLPSDEIGELVQHRNRRVKELATTQRELAARTAGLQEAVTELEHVSYSIMHDMRAPLRAMTGFGDLLLATEAQRLSPEGRDFLARLKAAAQRMDDLICDVLSYNSVVLQDLPLKQVSVSELMQRIVQTDARFQPEAAEINFPPDLPSVWANEAGLTQCISHLLVNAIKFVEPGQHPRIRIRGERMNNVVRIWVEDNGIGVPKIMQDRVFGIFQRGKNTGEGTGMGLAIVRKIIERMGGRVGLVSEPGQGSRFWMELKWGRSDPSTQHFEKQSDSKPS